MPECKDVERKKTACETCVHSEVCMFKGDFTKVQTALDNLTIDFGGERGALHLHEMKYISANIICTHRKGNERVLF